MTSRRIEAVGRNGLAGLNWWKVGGRRQAESPLQAAACSGWFKPTLPVERELPH